MARQTFFSFHYERDAWRAGQVRNCNLLPTNDQHGFIDSVEWESIKRKGDDAVRRWIDDQLKGTTVTTVLIGRETAERPWVQREIMRSWNRGNGIVGMRIHGIKDQNSESDLAGPDPFDLFKLPDGALLSSVCKVHDWVLDDGRNNLGQWSENAIEARAPYGVGDEIVYFAEPRKEAASVGVIRNLSASVGFAPRAPWCADYVARRR